MTQLITPGVGLDCIQLNDSFYKILNQFKDHDLNVVCSSKKYLDIPIRLEIRSLGVNLLFKNDKVILIEIVDFKCLDYIYHNINLNHILENNGNHLKTLYNKVFGPTYPGRQCESNYLLDYPGIGFKFKLNSSKTMDLSDLLSNDHDIKCVRIMIFGTNSYQSLIESIRENTEVSIPKTLGISEPRFSIRSNLLLRKSELRLGDSTMVITLGITTQQDILNFLGPPDDYFNKFDTRFLIHNKLKEASHKDNRILKFHNYFKFGVDFLYDLNKSGVVTKIIMYNGNLIESATFGHWNKCNYQIYFGRGSNPNALFSNTDSQVDSGFYFDDIPKDFKSTHEPIILNREENESINSDVVSINESKSNWGESKLYFSDSCIWEVLKNNCISCVTLF